MPTSKPLLTSEMIIWLGRPYILPSSIVRSISFFVAIALVYWFEIFFGVAFIDFIGLPVYVWTLVVLMVAWLFSLIHLGFVWLANRYFLRRDSLEVKHGLVTLHSFVVTPYGFADLEVQQSLSGRIFRYGNVTINSQSRNTIKLQFVKSPFKVAEQIRAVMSKPSVHLDESYV